MGLQHISQAVAESLESHGIARVVRLWFDGACEPVNPGGIATGGWIIRDGEQVYTGHNEVCRGDGATNNVAEWTALGMALRYMLDNSQQFSGSVLTIYGDSQLVIEQLNRRWKCNKIHLQKLRDRCWAILGELALPSWTATWIPREQNTEADALSRKAYEEATGKCFPERARR